MEDLPQFPRTGSAQADYITESMVAQNLLSNPRSVVGNPEPRQTECLPGTDPCVVSGRFSPP